MLFHLKRLVMGVRARKNRSGDRELPWKIPCLKVMALVLMMSSCVHKLIFVCHCLIIVCMKCCVCVSILYMLGHSSIHLCGALLYAFL